MTGRKIDNYEMKAATSIYSFQNVINQDPTSNILTCNKIEIYHIYTSWEPRCRLTVAWWEKPWAIGPYGDSEQRIKLECCYLPHYHWNFGLGAYRPPPLLQDVEIGLANDLLLICFGSLPCNLCIFTAPCSAS